MLLGPASFQTRIRITVLCAAVLATNIAVCKNLVFASDEVHDDSLFFEARIAVHDGRFELADDLLHVVLNKSPDHRLAWAYLAAVDMFLWRDPTPSLQRAVGSGEDEAGKPSMVAIVSAFATGELDQCAYELIDYLGEREDDLFAQDLLGMTYTELGLTQEAVETLRGLLREHPEFVPAWFHLGSAFLEGGDLPKARAAFGRFLEDSSPGNPAAFDAMAEISARSGDLERAVQYLHRVLEIEPRMAQAWQHMGDILSEAGDKDGAAAAYHKAIESSHLYGDPFRESVEQRLSEL